MLRKKKKKIDAKKDENERKSDQKKVRKSLKVVSGKIPS